MNRWYADEVPRKWTGSPWPEVVYLGPPPITKVERKQWAAGRWLRPVSVSWSSGQPVFLAGQPHPWMLTDPAWKDSIRDYMERLGSRKPLPGAVRVLPERASGEPANDVPRALPEANTARDRYMAILQKLGAATDKEAAEAAGLPLPTVRRVRGELGTRVMTDGGRPARWSLAE